jgi:hypothetical protein
VPVLGVVGVLLAESFGREIWWLWRTRGVGEEILVEPATVGVPRG